MNYKNVSLLLIIFSQLFIYGQNLDKLGKAPLFNLKGGVGLNTVFYDGNSNREPFTYFLSGNVNLNISDVYNIPFSFSYSNSKLQTNNPFTFNRLSIHPSYKWVTTHIGDVNMSFSPYTLNGHQFTGLGVDLAPSEKFSFSVMYGRLLEGREFDEENLNGEANYKRVGYGFKTSYTFGKAKLGAIFFRAADDKTSIKKPIPIENEVQPKENTVISFDGEFTVWKSLKLKGEVALSALTEDTRVSGTSNHYASFLVSGNPTTQYYKAYNLNFVYQVGKGSIGLGYEFIDPNYNTLGGYFFNNDLENITVNASQTIFNDKVAISFNAGLQKDDLDGDKASQLRRLVSAVNLAYTASKKLNITAGYSSFQSFTNIKNQFDYINGVNQIEEALDQDNIAQISQNANLNLNYNLKDTKQLRQSINVNISYQDAVNKIDEKVRLEDNSSFYNMNSVYAIAYPQSDFSISGALNTSYSELGADRNIIIGPTLSATKGFLEKKLKVSSALSYNESINNGERQGNVTNVRLGSRYVYKKQHNFNLTGLFQLRNAMTSTNQSMTLTFGYTYNFGIFNSKNFKRGQRKKLANTDALRLKPSDKDHLKFKYKDTEYVGTIHQINSQIELLLTSKAFESISSASLQALEERRVKISKERKHRVYKLEALNLLKDAYSEKNNIGRFNELLFESISELYEDVMRQDFSIEKSFMLNKLELEKQDLWNLSEQERLKVSKSRQVQFLRKYNIYKKALRNFLIHRWMLSVLKSYTTMTSIKDTDSLLYRFKNKHAEDVFKMFKIKDKKPKIKLYLLASMVDFLSQESEVHIQEGYYDLKYINQSNP